MCVWGGSTEVRELLSNFVSPLSVSDARRMTDYLHILIK